MAKRKSSAELKQKQDALRQKMQSLAAQERDLAAQIKQIEKSEHVERLLAAGEAFERAAAKHKLKVVFDAETATALAAFAAQAGFGNDKAGKA